jgi:hypothetical protein
MRQTRQSRKFEPAKKQTKKATESVTVLFGYTITKHLARVDRKKREELILVWGKMQRFPAQRDKPLLVIDTKLADGFAHPPLRLGTHGFRAVPQRGADTCEQLRRSEGLHDMVVRAKIERCDLVPLQAARGDDDHGRAGSALDGVQHLYPHRPAGNIKPNKEKSTEIIDVAVATIMALDRALRSGGSEGKSVYDERGLLAF